MVIERTVVGMGYELIDIERAQHGLLRITIDRIPGRVERELKGQGYEVARSAYTFGFAAVHAVRVHDDGLDGGADPGHDGIVIAV